jgi:hypothetical protein
VNNGEFVKNHPPLQSYLRDHPGAREEFKEHPDAFMRQEERFDQREDRRSNDVSREELARFNQFLDSHREIAEQVRKNPSLVNNQAFMENHPALLTYMHEHPELREQVKQNPTVFTAQDNRFDHPEDRRDRDNDAMHSEKARFDQFLDGHRELAEQVRRDPSLVNNEQFEKNHPELQAYIAEHPEIREEARANPDSFMARQDTYDRHEETGDHDAMRDKSANFREFLGSHTEIAQQLARDPSLARSREYVEKHPELQGYLKAHPDVNQELMKNPQTFVKSSQPFNNMDPGVKPPMYDPKATH